MTANAPISPANELYGDPYADWKSWRESQFAQLNCSMRGYFAAEVRRIGRPLAAGAKVLELGFGNGAFLRFGRDNGWQMSGTELDERLVAAARSIDFDAHRCADLEQFDSNSFELIAAFDVLEHLPPDQLIGVVRSVARVLKPGGVFLCRVPNGDSPFGLSLQHGDLTHISNIGSGKLRHLSAQAGLDVVLVAGEAEPFTGVSARLLLHRLFAYPMKRLLNACVNALYFPAQPVAFAWANLTAVLQKPSAAVSRAE
jgi:SAM-dependent methyltransferase